MVGVEYNVKIRDLEPLTEGHWAVWSREVKFSFLEAGIAHYLDESYAPTEGDMKKPHSNWKAINSCIIGTLGRHITPALTQELEEDMSTTEAWKLLNKRTQQDRIFAKLNTMHNTLHTKFSFGMPTIDTLGELKNLLENIYQGGQAPTFNEWSIILMLNVLEGSNYNSLHCQLVSQFQNAKMTPSQTEVHDAITFTGFEHK